MIEEIESRVDAVFNKWDSLPTDEARRIALADALIAVESSHWITDFLDALESATRKRRQVARLLQKAT